MLSHSVGLCGVTDTERTILSAVNRLALDPDVESDAMVSCAADERSCGQSVSQTGSRLSPSVRTKDDISSGLQETLSTTDSMYYVGTARGGRSTAGETVMLTSRGSAGNWNSSFVLPVDDQRTSNKRQSSPLHADTSPQTEVSGGHSAVGGLIRENVKLREVNKRQAEKIVQLTTELTGARSVPRSSEERSMELHLLNEQMAVYKEDFENERRDKERALSEKESLIKQTTSLLNDLKALQERKSQLERALQIARQHTSSDDEERLRFASRWAEND